MLFFKLEDDLVLDNVSAELWCTPEDGAEHSLGQGGLSTSLNLCAGPCIAESGFVSGVSSVREANGTFWSQGGTGESRWALAMGVSWGEFKPSQKALKYLQSI